MLVSAYNEICTTHYTTRGSQSYGSQDAVESAYQISCCIRSVALLRRACTHVLLGAGSRRRMLRWQCKKPAADMLLNMQAWFPRTLPLHLQCGGRLQESRSDFIFGSGSRTGSTDMLFTRSKIQTFRPPILWHMIASIRLLTDLGVESPETRPRVLS